MNIGKDEKEKEERMERRKMTKLSSLPRRPKLQYTEGHVEGHVDGDSTMLIGKLNPLGPLHSTALAAKLLRFTVSSL